MALTPDEKRRQQELEAQGHKGATNPESHYWNVKENIDKSDSELMRIVEEKERIHGEGWAKKARATLRSRGHDY